MRVAYAGALTAGARRHRVCPTNKGRPDDA